MDAAGSMASPDDSGFCLVPGRTVGRWAVTTESSAYELDYDRMTVTRVPGAGMPGVPGAALRRDAEAVPLLDAAPVQVGQPMSLLVDVRGDGVRTLRRSTPVVRIAVLPASPCADAAALIEGVARRQPGSASGASGGRRC